MIFLALYVLEGLKVDILELKNPSTLKTLANETLTFGHVMPTNDDEPAVTR